MSSSLPTPVTAEGKDGLAGFLAEPGRGVVALDFDGTLAPIVADPDSARAHPGAIPALARLAPLVGSVTVVTGRPAEVAVRYGGFAGVPGLERLVVLGHYGAERWDAVGGEVRAPDDHPGVEALRAELPGFLERMGAEPGTSVEDKGRSLAVHTRRTAHPHAALDALDAPLRELAAGHGLIAEPGRMVLELRPPGMDKGVALSDHLREVDAGPVVYGGDDLGDLAAFAAVRRRRSQGHPGLLVCSGSASSGTASGHGSASGHGGDSAGEDDDEQVTELAALADLVVPGPAGVVAFLGALADALEQR
jgi:trehalose 6-phosphate phosphatase